MTRPIALVDLDDSLFQTLRKCPSGELPLVPLGFARDGEALSYATPRQMALLDWLGSTTRLIPVTARSLDALRRVKISFTAAICAHGGVMLDDAGMVDPVWADYIAGQAHGHAAMLGELANSVRRAAAPAKLSVRVLTEGEVGLYVLVKHPEADDRALRAVIDLMVHEVPAGWTVHQNSNNFAFMPPFLGKQHAVAALLPRLRERYPDAPILGLGDSVTDAPFMALCDYAVLPAGSQLAKALIAGLA